MFIFKSNPFSQTDNIMLLLLNVTGGDLNSIRCSVHWALNGHVQNKTLKLK
jgi:hypothetical protein